MLDLTLQRLAEKATQTASAATRLLTALADKIEAENQKNGIR